MSESNYYAQELEKIYKDLQTDPKIGLTQAEAKERLEQNGPNEIPKVSKGFIKIYLAPLFNWLIVIYLIGAVILWLAAISSNENPPLMIYIVLAIVFLNCFIAIYQQYKATKKLEALRELSAPTTTVIRDGNKIDIPSKEVVVGDLLILNQGDKIPADARIIESTNLEVNEASLTGESEPVRKVSYGDPLISENVPISARLNMAFYGTYVTTGNGSTIVVKTGIDTEIGKISKGLEEAGTSKIPIREKMNNFGKWLGIIVFIMWGVSLIVLFIATQKWEIVESLNAALDIMPINLPLLTAIVLITGVLAMAKEGVIIRNLASVDSLGRVSIVCSDKTGTLTQNQMCIQRVWVNGETFIITGEGYNPEGEILLKKEESKVKIDKIDSYPYLKLLLTAGFLNNNSALVKNEVEVSGTLIEKWSVVGSPTEGALMVLFQKCMGDASLNEYELIKEYPFDSSIKRMSKLYKKEGEYYSFTKGASEVVVKLCNKIVYNNAEINITEELRQEVYDKVNKYANKGYRILSLCYRKMNQLPSDPESDEARELCESNMVYIGFVTILDPPREGVKESVQQCHSAGVDVVMITGDSPATAKAIASKIGIVQNESDMAIEGWQIEELIDTKEFDDVKVFARVAPKHKEMIIKKYQSQKRVVSMTGDGVNDALALNMADAGVAMGITGTDVAKEASDMVISDDSFNSIVTGIRQGRGIFAKIRTIVFFYIAINIFEGLVGFILAVVLDFPYWVDPYSTFAPQWVFLSLTVHALPGLALTFDTISDDVMNEEPRDSEEILSKNILYLMLSFGALLAISMCLAYFLCITNVYGYEQNTELGAWNEFYLYTKDTAKYTKGIKYNEAKAFTMLMAVLFITETMLVFQIRRPNQSIIESFKEHDFNIFMVFLVGLTWFAFLALMYIPVTQVVIADMAKSGGFWNTINFKFMYLTGLDWLVALGISSICVLGFEAVKYYAHYKGITF
ncbi:MAG: cation-translocating P-type ATPase [Promethearchaeota archaeon]